MKERPDAPACPSSVPLPHTAAHSQPPVAPGSDLGPGRPGRAGEVGCGRWAAREARQRCLLQLRATNTSSGRRSEPTGKAQQPDIERHYIKFFAHPDLAYIALRGSARHTWLQRTAPLRLLLFGRPAAPLLPLAALLPARRRTPSQLDLCLLRECGVVCGSPHPACGVAGPSFPALYSSTETGCACTSR